MDNIDILGIAPPFQVRSFGRVVDQPKHFTGTKQGDIMLVINLDGVGHFRNQKATQVVKPSTVGFILPDENGVLYCDSDQPYDHLYCRFQGEYAVVLVQHLIHKKGSSFFAHEGVEGLSQYFRELQPVIRKELPKRMGEYELVLARVLTELQGKEDERESHKLSAHTLRSYIENRLDELIDLDRMAEHFSLSKSALCRSAKKLLGDTIVNTSHSIRVEYACGLLSMQEMNVNEVARRVGFKDSFYFSRVFKNKTGKSPKQWQKERI